MCISDWSSDVCSSDLSGARGRRAQHRVAGRTPVHRVPAAVRGRCADPDGGRDRSGHAHPSQARGHQAPGPERAGEGPGRGSLPHGEDGCERSEEHTSELQSLMSTSYAVFCLKKKQNDKNNTKKRSKKYYKRQTSKTIDANKEKPNKQ